MTYLEVAVCAPLGHTLTYTTPDLDTNQQPEPGTRLLVPLGGRQITGYLLGPAQEPAPGQKIKPITEVVDPEPLFPASMVPFFRWTADYYHFPIGEVIKTGLPAGLTARSGRRAQLTSTGQAPIQTEAAKAEAPKWLLELLTKSELTPAAMRRITKARDRRLLATWEKKGWLTVSQELTGQTTKAKTETCVNACTTQNALQAVDLKPSEKKTLELLNRLATESGRQVIARKDLNREYSSASKALKSLADKGLIRFEEHRVLRDPFGEPPPFFPPPEKLTAEQEIALAQLGPAIKEEKFAPFLLHGVTGSGKTEVYLRAAAEVLKSGRSVLVLVPEIALATQLEGHFHSRFGDAVALLHSGLSKGERFDQWHRMASGEATIVIGARSAVFAPLADPGLIIVDEEHDPAYKQEDGLRYQGRDLAVLRASLQNSVVLLGSATPSVTSKYHARHHKYQLLSLTKRVAGRAMPEVQVVDLQAAKTVSGRAPLFTRELYLAMRETLARGEQSLIFLNRRGFASVVLCNQCGKTVQCNHCQVSLTQHRQRNELLCHYCGFTSRADIVCPNCENGELTGVGFGTERVEQELTSLFPKARIARLDRDSATNRKNFLAILQAVRHQEIDILVGTQMITKGHHFPHVTLVGVVWADAGMGMPDFRAGERTFQLLSQVTGRAGRGEQPGRVIIQTHQPEHYSITTAQSHDYEQLFERELALRQGLDFPPFCRLISFLLEGDREALVRQVAQELAHKVRHYIDGQPETSLLGPVPAPLARLRGKYRYQMLLKGKKLERLHQICEQLLRDPLPTIRSGAVKLAVDVDPENML